jgi:hypothetical protein
MTLLKEKLDSREIQGINVGDNKQVLYQLFADDIELFLKQLKQIFVLSWRLSAVVRGLLVPS